MVLWVAIHHLKSSSVGAFAGHHWGGSSWWWCGQKKLSSCAVQCLNKGLRREVVTHFQWLWHWHSVWKVQIHEDICVHSLLLVDIADQTLLQIKYCTANSWKVYRYTKAWIQSVACWHNHATWHVSRLLHCQLMESVQIHKDMNTICSLLTWPTTRTAN